MTIEAFAFGVPFGLAIALLRRSGPVGVVAWAVVAGFVTARLVASNAPSDVFGLLFGAVVFGTLLLEEF